MLPILLVDIVPFKYDNSKYLFVAVGVDGNHDSLLLAYAVGTTESVENWSWFLRRLKDVIGDARNVAFISKMSAYITSTLTTIFPESYHGFCCFSVAANLISRTGHNSEIEEMFLETSKTYDVTEFGKRMVHLQHALRNSVDANAWLDNIPTTKWARAFFPKSRFNVSTVHIPDGLQRLSYCRDNLSIPQLIHRIHDHIEAMCRQRYSFGESLVEGITPYAETKLDLRLYRSTTWRATKDLPSIFRVHNSFCIHLVNLDRGICNCGEWKKTGIPCAHAIAAIRMSNTQDIHQFVNYVLTSEVYRSAYASETVRSIPPWEVWEFPNNVEIVLAP